MTCTCTRIPTLRANFTPSYHPRPMPRLRILNRNMSSVLRRNPWKVWLKRHSRRLIDENFNPGPIGKNTSAKLENFPASLARKTICVNFGNSQHHTPARHSSHFQVSYSVFSTLVLFFDWDAQEVSPCSHASACVRAPSYRIIRVWLIFVSVTPPYRISSRRRPTTVAAQETSTLFMIDVALLLLITC